MIQNNAVEIFSNAGSVANLVVYTHRTAPDASTDRLLVLDIKLKAVDQSSYCLLPIHFGAQESSTMSNLYVENLCLTERLKIIVRGDDSARTLAVPRQPAGYFTANGFPNSLTYFEAELISLRSDLGLRKGGNRVRRDR